MRSRARSTDRESDWMSTRSRWTSESRRQSSTMSTHLKITRNRIRRRRMVEISKSSIHLSNVYSITSPVVSRMFPIRSTRKALTSRMWCHRLCFSSNNQCPIRNGSVLSESHEIQNSTRLLIKRSDSASLTREKIRSSYPPIVNQRT